MRRTAILGAAAAVSSFLFLLPAGAGVAGAAPTNNQTPVVTPYRDTTRTITTADGWTISISKQREHLTRYPNLAQSPWTREGFATPQPQPPMTQHPTPTVTPGPSNTNDQPHTGESSASTPPEPGIDSQPNPKPQQPLESPAEQPAFRIPQDNLRPVITVEPNTTRQQSYAYLSGKAKCLFGATGATLMGNLTGIGVGAGAGAAIGSVVPGEGTVIGAAVGMGIGGSISTVGGLFTGVATFC